ncbi:ATP-binding protein [Chloroflexota bacterium]
MGINLSLGETGWQIHSVDTSGLASETGIKVGDTPVTINGLPATEFLVNYEEVGIVSGRLIREITVSDINGQLKSTSLDKGSQSPQSIIELISLFLVCIAFWITGFYTFFKRPTNQAALLLCISGLVFGMIASATAASASLIPGAFWIAIITTIMGPWILLHFFIVLPDERTWIRNNHRIYIIYLPAVITLILFPLVGYTNDQAVPWFRTVRIFEYGTAFLAVAIVAVLNYIQASSMRTRQQMKIVLIGCLTALIPALILTLLPQAMWQKSLIPPGFSTIFLIFIPLSMGYAVVTQKLMDIDVIVRRSVIYGLISLTLAIILSAAIFPVLSFHESIGVFGEIIIILALGGTATILFGPIKKGIEILIDRLFYKDRYDYRQIIQSLSLALNSIKNLTETSRLVVGTAVRALNLAGGGLFIRTQSGAFEVGTVQGTFVDMILQNSILDVISRRNREIEFPNSASTICSDLAFIIPLVAGEKEVAVLCISKKVTRQDFSSDDLFLLQGVASVASIALQSAILMRDVSIRDTFVSVASHELRTPLTSILGYADLLLHRDPPDETRKRWLKSIFNNSEKISSMIDDLLDVSRIRAGKANLQLSRVKVSDVLEETLSLSRESADRHEFIINITPDLPDILADQDKFFQIIDNILSNAIKYSPNGGRIIVSAYNDEERHRTVIKVEDEGIGMTPADKELLFKSFYRIQRPETQDISGSGLGLYIAKEWTEAMGGEIWLESELDRGSIFFVGFPVYESDKQLNVNPIFSNE